MEECPVCLNSADTVVKCVSCDYACCFGCTKRVICDQLQTHCINCKMGWTSAFLYDNFKKSWLNSTKTDGFRNSRKNLALEFEKAKIPYTFETLVAAQVEADREQLESLQASIESMQHYQRHYRLMEESYTLKLQLEEKGLEKSKKAELKKRVASLNREAGQAITAAKAANRRRRDGRSMSNEKAAAPKLLGRCPIGDCRGMIDAHGKCMTCEESVCTKCMVPLRGPSGDTIAKKDHKCDTDTIASVAAIRAESKPCPKCGVLISKNGGCSQMFCTDCKTGFSWATLQITDGPVQNPHAVEWQRTMGLAQRQDAGPCNDFPHMGQTTVRDKMIQGAFKRLAAEKEYKVIQFDTNTLYTIIYHIDTLIEVTESQSDAKLDEVRVKYCLNKITEKQWKDAIFRISRDRERKETKRRVLTSLREVAIERVVLLADIDTSRGRARGNKEYQERLQRAENAIYELFQLLLLAANTLDQELSLLGATKTRPWTLDMTGNKARFVLSETRHQRIRPAHIHYVWRPQVPPGSDTY